MSVRTFSSFVSKPKSATWELSRCCIRNAPKLWFVGIWLSVVRPRTRALKRSNYTHGHHPLHHSGLNFGGSLQPLHGPPLQHRCYFSIVGVEQAEARHVDPAVAIWLQVKGKQVLLRMKSKIIGAELRWFCFKRPNSRCDVHSKRMLD